MSTTRPPSADARLQLEPVSARSRIWIALLTFGVPLALSLLLPLLGHGSTSARRWMGASLIGERWLQSWSGPAMIALVLVTAWLVVDRLVRRHRLVIDAGGMEVATTLYRQRLAWADLDLPAARVIDIDEHPESKPMLKTSGVSLPGFRSGWFRSRNLTKLFVAVSGGSRLLRVPTRKGYTLLLQPRNPGAVLARLRELAGNPPTSSSSAANTLRGR